MPAIFIALCLAVTAAAQDAKPLVENAEQALDPKIGSPLERLRTRSSIERWKQLSRQSPEEQWIPDGTAPAPSGKPPVGADDLPASMKLLPPSDGSVPARKAIHAPDVGEQYVEAAQLEPVPQYTEPVRNPRELKNLAAILPYFDYEPDPDLDDPCLNLCPRPFDCPECLNKRIDDLLPGEIACSECPEEVSLAGDPYVDRCFPPFGYAWEPSNLWNYPLYFEDFTLERYGHTRPFYVQPVVSMAKFTGQTLFLPYQLSLNPPWRHKYSLGYYRPGQWVPYKYYQVPLDAQAAAVQAASVVGGYYLFAP